MKILTPKQMFQRLPIVLAQVKGGNTSKPVLNKIRQIIYSLYRAKFCILSSQIITQEAAMGFESLTHKLSWPN